MELLSKVPLTGTTILSCCTIIVLLLRSISILETPDKLIFFSNITPLTSPAFSMYILIIPSSCLVSARSTPEI